jgi:hypothetical protein
MQVSGIAAETAAPATVRAVRIMNSFRPLACAATVVALALTGCGSQHASGGRGASNPTTGAALAAASDGATAVWRANVTPIVCRYAQDVARSGQLIAQVSSNAGGPIDASAPEPAQAAYASALQLYASLLARDYAAFGRIHPPNVLSVEYGQFLASLHTLTEQANQLSRYAHARNFTAIANEQNVQTPTAGQRVFAEAGITSCAVPSP